MPSAFDLWREGDELGPRAQQDLEAVLVEAALLVEGHELEVGVLLLGEQLPGHEVGVVLHLGEHDRVRPADVPAAPGVGDEVDGLGRVADEDDLARVGRVDEGRDRDARILVGRGRLLADRVDAAMDVGAVARVVARRPRRARRAA